MNHSRAEGELTALSTSTLLGPDQTNTSALPSVSTLLRYCAFLIPSYFQNTFFPFLMPALRIPGWRIPIQGQSVFVQLHRSHVLWYVIQLKVPLNYLLKKKSVLQRRLFISQWRIFGSIMLVENSSKIHSLHFALLLLTIWCWVEQHMSNYPWHDVALHQNIHVSNDGWSMSGEKAASKLISFKTLQNRFQSTTGISHVIKGLYIPHRKDQGASVTLNKTLENTGVFLETRGIPSSTLFPPFELFHA